MSVLRRLFYADVKERREIIEEEIKRSGLKYRIQAFEIKGYSGANIIITDFLRTENPLVITAHYDGFGAYDNCSGILGLLWLIRWAKKDRNRTLNLLPVFVDGEERGLLGSAYFLESLDGLKPYAHLSIDGFGIGTKICGFANVKEIEMSANGKKEVLKLRADTTLFQEYGIPSLHIFTLPEEDAEALKNRIFPETFRILHTQEDTPDKVQENLIPFLSLRLYRAIPALNFKHRGIFILGDE